MFDSGMLVSDGPIFADGQLLGNLYAVIWTWLSNLLPFMNLGELDRP
ncbi:MAG: hypothetical protein ABL921_18300 [Pirellula sp.]